MTVYEKILRAAQRDEGVTLGVQDTAAVLSALNWARRQLDSLNDLDDETDGGNCELSGLDEEADQ